MFTVNISPVLIGPRTGCCPRTDCDWLFFSAQGWLHPKKLAIYSSTTILTLKSLLLTISFMNACLQHSKLKINLLLDTNYYIVIAFSDSITITNSNCCRWSRKTIANSDCVISFKLCLLRVLTIIIHLIIKHTFYW